MQSFSQALIVNIGEDYIRTYLRKKGINQAEDEKGKELKYWVDDLLEKGRINIDEFEAFLFDELLYGKRKTIRVFRLDKYRSYKYPKDWEEVFKEKYGLDSLDFSDIIASIPNINNQRRIVACRIEENSKGELIRLTLIVGYYIQMESNNGLMESVSYVPVELDFKKKLMILKAWTRKRVKDDYKADELLGHTKQLMQIEFKVSTKEYWNSHRETLFKMSQRLISDAYSHLPNYKNVNALEDTLDYFIGTTLSRLSLENVTTGSQGEPLLVEGVMDYRGELKNVIEGLIVSDYFYKRRFEDIWDLGLEAIVARIKFSDKENVLTSLKAENTSDPIFCTKTFMSIKKRLEETQKVEAIWIAINERKIGKLNLKYDASNEGYLELLIRYGIRFDEEDMKSAMELYDKYESRND